MATSPSERSGFPALPGRSGPATPQHVAAIVAALALGKDWQPVTPTAQPLDRWRSSGRSWAAPVDEHDDDTWDRR